MALTPPVAATKAGTMDGAQEACDAVCTVHQGGTSESDKAAKGPQGAAPCSEGTSDVETLEAAALSVVVTTVAQALAAVLQAQQSGHGDLVVLGRCSVCGRVGRVVHFDGALRARPREVDP